MSIDLSMNANENLQTARREPLYTIGVAARKLGVSPETLRFYEHEGLLIVYRTETGRRLYSQRDLDWISCFRERMAENRLNVAGIRLLLALMPCWDLKPCTKEDQQRCQAYLNYKVVCWAVDTPASAACDLDECRQCHVYLDSCRAGKLERMFVTTKED